MIPEKDKKYGIACLGPYDYNQFGGVGVHTGAVNGTYDTDEDENDERLYEFVIMGNDLAWFLEKDIICEAL